MDFAIECDKHPMGALFRVMNVLVSESVCVVLDIK